MEYAGRPTVRGGERQFRVEICKDKFKPQPVSFLRPVSRKYPAVQPEAASEDQVTAAQTKASYHERKLHPLVAYFAYTNTEFNRGRQVYTKTILHEKAKHSAPAEWVYPDLVGFYSPIEAWSSALTEFSKVTDKSAIRLYSFEVKKVNKPQQLSRELLPDGF